jgi:hypothetical protein
MEPSTNGNRVLGKLIGNTGDPMKLHVALRDSYAARRGEFVRIMHQESWGPTTTSMSFQLCQLAKRW